MHSLNLVITGPEVADAVADFMPKLANAMRAEHARQQVEWEKNYGAGAANALLGNSTQAVSGPAETKTAVVAEVRVLEGSKPELGPASKNRPAKKAAPAEEPKQEVKETCLDVKPSAETQQELPLKTAAEIGYEPAAPELTIDDLRRHLRAYGQGNGAEALSSLYAEYGAKQLSDLPADKYAEIIAKVSA